MASEELADWGAHVGEEMRKTFDRYQSNGFFDKYFAGPNILDVGYKGYLADAHPIFPHAVGVDLDYPGYDGRTLPFADQSQDTVLASHILEHIPDYRQALREWFRVLKIGGYMVVTVPQQYLYERKATLPSRFNADHKRLYTAASLMLEVEDSLDPMSYRLRMLEDNDENFNYASPPERHSRGCCELVMVLQRMVRPDYADAVLMPPPPPPSSFGGRYAAVANLDSHEPLMTLESDTPAKRVLILKLDHRGDFITAGPALRVLRARFATSHLTLACGSWTEAAAHELGLFDAIVTADFFPEVSSDAYSDFYANDGTVRFTKAIAGQSFDLAIDLRVDADTRHLLAEVDAKHRAGFGGVQEFPYLDIFLPYNNPTLENRAYQRLLTPDAFGTRVGRHEGFSIVHDDRRVGAPITAGAPLVARGRPEPAPAVAGGQPEPEELHPTLNGGDVLIFGPWQTFEAGSWRMEIVVEPLQRNFDLAYDVCSASGEVIHQVGMLAVRRGRNPSFILELTETLKRMEIRLRMPQPGRLPPFRFNGIKAYKKGTMPALHQQEMQLLLADLVALRMENPFLESELPA